MIYNGQEITNEMIAELEHMEAHGDEIASEHLENIFKIINESL